MPLLRARELLDFIVKAFERAWDAMALADFDPEVGGKFMFARQAMVLLELASRVATEDEELHRAFSAEIERSQPLYFTPLPAGPSRWPKGFRLPYSRARDHSQRQLLPVLFDLVRNGQMHYGEQLSVPLKDGTIFGVALGGVTPGRTVDELRREPGRPIDHLAFNKRRGGHFELWVSTGVLFVDLQAAAERAEVFEGGASFEPFVREWDTTSAELEGAIRDTSHLLWEERADE